MVMLFDSWGGALYPLAQGRYDLGLSSILELTQAQLNLTRAEIESLAAKYDYELQHSTLQFSIGSLR